MLELPLILTSCYGNSPLRKKCPKKRVFSVPYFPVFQLNGDRKNSVLGHFSRSAPNSFPMLFIHLWDFHMIKENLKIVGLLLQSSGSEEIVCQTRMCTSGSLCGVMSGVQ